jgi:hypothetical protein
VIGRRFNASPSPIQHNQPTPPLAEEEEESSIQLYLPQLSPEISFCEASSNSTLDFPSDSEDNYDSDTENQEQGQQRPGIKKRVSFSEQLSTFIPPCSNDDSSSSTSTASVIEEQQERPCSPMTKFVRKLSHELMDASSMLVAEKRVNSTPRHKFVPAPVVSEKKEVAALVAPKAKLVGFGSNNMGTGSPQKLSNKLLDMFQKKQIIQPKSAAVNSSLPPPATASTRELTHVSCIYSSTQMISF